MKNILLVDGCEELLSVMKTVLCYPNIKLFSATSGYEALSILETFSIDLVLTELDMDEGNGEWLLKEFKRLRHPAPVVVISGAHLMSAEEILKLGARAFIQKPTELRPVLDVINNLLGIHL